MRVRASVLFVLSIVAGLGWVALPAPALADTAPPAGTPATVSADVLPTWQINGVVWDQQVAGNTVYAGGSFTMARPPGASPKAANQIPANNFFAYDIRTGARIASISHDFNAQILAMALSPDGTKLYVGGDFTRVDGFVHNHVAAFNAATGALINSFTAATANQVRALAVTNSTVYAGGTFLKAGNAVSRARLAAFNATSGALLDWAPVADSNRVSALVMSPDNSKVIVGGGFNQLNGTDASGMGAVDATTGATLTWKANTTIRDGGSASGITSLSTDGNQIYGSGFAFGSGQFEGAFAASPSDGTLAWANDCHGDTYDTYPSNQVLYTVSHAHNCSMIGAFPQTDPWEVNMRHALAFTTYAAGTNTGPDDYGWNYNGVPASKMLQWYPDLATGTVTGQGQAAWNVTGNGQYVAMGGEFPRINGTDQQGLARFAVHSIAPNKRAPVSAPGAPAPSANSFESGTARVAWQSAYDMDNASLTYQVYRSDKPGTPVYTKTQDSNYWTYPMMGFIDKTVTNGQSYTYTVKVTDPDGNLLTLPQSNSVTVSAAAQSAYSKDVLDDGASNFYRLGEQSGSTVYDHAGFNDATASSGVTRGADGAIASDSDDASTFNGTSDGLVAENSAQEATPSFSVESWVKTTSHSGGKIVGYGNAKSGDSSGYDRHVFLDNAGHVVFGVYPGDTRTVSSPGVVNDGNWHHIVASLSSSNGMTLFVDGKKVAADASTTTAQDYSGYWRIGGDNLGGWPNQPDSNYVNGTIDDVAIYPSALTLSKVQQHYTDSGRTLNANPRPADAYGKAIYDADPDIYWRLGESSGTVAKDSGPAGENGTYFGGTTQGQAGGVAGTSDTAVGFNGSNGGVSSVDTYTNPRVYSEELWFKTNTNNGGKLIGFGDHDASATSGSYDRHVFMLPSGELVFGTWTGQENTITSAAKYNNGQWHHVVARQDSNGMALYVDGQSVGTNPQTEAQAYTGYWRIGGDNAWDGSPPWFNGTIDEVAVYSKSLSASEITAHYNLGSGAGPANQDPVAAFSSSVANQDVTFNGSGSSDPDGDGLTYLWDFGDGTSDTGATPPVHHYGAAKTYTVKLTVNDGKGGSNSVSHDVNTTAANGNPVAAFSSTVANQDVTFNGSGSSDPDGDALTYLWDFGDGTSDTGVTPPVHHYGAAKTYTVKLTVNDGKGGSNSVSHDVNTTAANGNPVAAFSSTVANQDVTFNGSGSSDPDGDALTYLWDFGDGTSDTGVTPPVHHYAAAKTYTVKLTVNDGKGGSNSVSHDVVTTAPPAGAKLIASDDFGRTLASGWGNADQGGAWTTSPANNFKVGGGVGTATLPTAGATRTATLGSVSNSDTDLQVTVSPQQLATGGGTYTTVIARTVGSNSYRSQLIFKSNGQVTLNILKVVGTTTTNLVASKTISGVTYAAGDKLNLRVQATGTSPTTVRARVWKVGQTEPTAWQVTTTDSTAGLQSAGTVSLVSYLSGSSTATPVTLTYDALRIYDTTG